jgi:hypothetical protein
MKKTLTLSLLLLALFSGQTMKSQIEQGNSVIDLSAKLGIYTDQFTLKGLSATKKGNTGSGIYALGYEYMALNWLGLGLQLRYDKYIDSASQKQTTYSFNVPVYANIHFVRTEHIDLSAGASFGYSHFSINSNSAGNAQISGNGTLFDFHLTPRFFFGEHLGISIPIAYTFFNYSSLNYKDNAQTINDWGSLAVKGISFGLGVNYQF